MADLKIVIGNKNYSTWSLRGWLAAMHTGLVVQEINIELYTPGSKAKLLEYSPTGQVPALVHGDITVWDSLAIIDYCARLEPRQYWWPEDNAAYALARSMSAEMHSGFMALRTHAPMNIRAKWSGLTLSEDVARDVARIDALWIEAREKFGSKEQKNSGDFLFGDFSAADMMFAPVVYRFETYGISVSPTARAYMDAMLDYDLMQAWTHFALKETAIIAAGEVPKGATNLG